MDIIIEGKLAEISEGQSIQLVSENALFSGADTYSFAIKFPLEGSECNKHIFGDINRKDIAVSKMKYECEFREKDEVRYGVLVIVGVSRSEVSCQFLEGRSVQNFDETFDSIYIDTLELAHCWSRSTDEIAGLAFGGYDLGKDFVFYPWVNNSSDSGILHNCMRWDGNNYRWYHSVDTPNEPMTLSGQIFLLSLTRLIIEKIGYTCDLSEWEKHPQWKNLLCLNALPPVWGLPDVARALPHWTVEEYFDQLELLLGGLFTIDHKKQDVAFKFLKKQKDMPVVVLDQVEADYTEDISHDVKESDYIDARRIAYAFDDDTLSKYYDCEWFVKLKRGDRTGIEEYDTMDKLISANEWLKYTDHPYSRETNMSRLLYVRDIDLYFVLRAWDYRKVDGKKGYRYYLYPISANEFGPSKGLHRSKEVEDEDTTELKIVPARIDYTEHGFGLCVFLTPSGFDEPARSTDSSDDETTGQPQSAWQIENGERTDQASYYDKIYVGFGDTERDCTPDMPRPAISEIDVDPSTWKYEISGYSLRLNGGESKYTGVEIIPESAVNYKFLSKTIPDPRSLFLIHSQPYVCGKITATITDNGMSERMEGVFYRVQNQSGSTAP